MLCKQNLCHTLSVTWPDPWCPMALFPSLLSPYCSGLGPLPPLQGWGLSPSARRPLLGGREGPGALWKVRSLKKHRLCYNLLRKCSRTDMDPSG